MNIKKKKIVEVRLQFSKFSIFQFYAHPQIYTRKLYLGKQVAMQDISCSIIYILLLSIAILISRCGALSHKTTKSIKSLIGI